jgi:hypothetical protein
MMPYVDKEHSPTAPGRRGEGPLQFLDESIAVGGNQRARVATKMFSLKPHDLTFNKAIASVELAASVYRHAPLAEAIQSHSRTSHAEE